TRVVACVAVASCFPGCSGPVTLQAGVFPAFQGDSGVVVFSPTVGMRHLQAVARIAELLLGVTRRTCELCVEEGNPVCPAPLRVQMARRPGNHREGVTG
ncbi:MAG: hypothetical protein MUQ27_12940, partial [Acidimicrobiia bacterium]|nr:hypothetical protein [Acidimicrobiia bacterium]